MGSIQQVAMAAVCLTAAFAFGSFINQSPEQSSNQTQIASSDGLRSLIEPEMAIQKSPAKTPWMKPKLSARLPMPNLYNDDAASNAGVIPPPSDLSGRIGVSQNNWQTASPTPSQITDVIADAPTFSSDTASESSMPTVITPHAGNSLNLVDSIQSRSGFNPTNETTTDVENAPVFTAPDFETAASMTSPLSTSNQPQQTYTTSPTERYNYTIRPTESATQTAIQPTIITPPAVAFKTQEPNWQNQRRQNFNNDRNPNGLMPIPRIKQTVTIDDPGAAFGNRDSQPDWNSQPEWKTPNSQSANNSGSEYYPDASRQQHRVARLPLQLNSNAKTRLTRIRDNTIQKISLSTTQFSEYVVQQGDTLQSIASDHFGKADYYLDIYLANREQLRFPGDIRNGMIIKIPVYQ